MRDHAKLRAYELSDEVHLDSVHAQRLTAFSLQPKHLVVTQRHKRRHRNFAVIPQMNDPAASRGGSSSVLASYSVRDTPAPYLIRGKPVGPCWIPVPAPDFRSGVRWYDELAARRRE